jgi:hypothetical protein
MSDVLEVMRESIAKREAQLAAQSPLPAIDTDSPAELVATAIIALNRLKERTREIEQQFKAGPLKEWLSKHGQIEIGPVRYYVGTETKVKCRDTAVAATFIAEACGISAEGLQKFVAMLASDCLKQGAVNAFLVEIGLPDMFEELFEVKVVEDVKTGKPLKKVREINDRFIK